MKTIPTDAMIRAAVARFSSVGEIRSYQRLETGHINDTYVLTTTEGKFLLQRLSPIAFKDPIKVMENIIGVTHFLNLRIQEEGGDPLRECLNLVQNNDGDFYEVDEEGYCWRIYLFIEGKTYDMPENPEQFRLAAEAFGRFQYLLQSYPSQTLYETIPHFHDTPKRFRDFEAAVKSDKKGRVASCPEIIQEAFDRREQISVIVDGLKSGSLPLRTTHNDTKLNNVMFDVTGKKPLAILDLDTVMPGSALYDFGDSIRFGANTCLEDEKDTSKIHFSLPMFEAYAKGFIHGANHSLSEHEIRLFPYAAWLMTYECGIRFLADYLEGDVYFHVAYPEHNLVRALDQFALLKDMEKNRAEADEIIVKLLHEEE